MSMSLSAEDAGDHHGFGSSSFRINPASELPKSRPTAGAGHATSAPNMGHSMNGSWDYSSFAPDNQTDYGNDQHSDNAKGALYSSTSSSTIKATDSRPRSPIVPKTAPITRFIPSSRKNMVSAAEVWRDIVVASNGRDKALKIIQYTFRLYILFHARAARMFNNPKLGGQLIKRLQTTVSGLSLARRCLLLFNWLAPLLLIVRPSSLPFISPPGSPTTSFSSSSAKKSQRPLLHLFLHAPPLTLLELCNAVSDDVYTFSKLGLIATPIGNRADKISNWLWLLATLAGLVEVGYDQATVRSLMSDLEDRIYDDEMDPSLIGRGGKAGRGKSNSDSIGLHPTGKPNRVDLSVGVEEADVGLQKLQKQYQTLRLTRWKLIMDLVFVSYDVFKIQRLREPVMAVSGLASAILSSKKVFDQQFSKLTKGGDDD